MTPPATVQHPSTCACRGSGWVCEDHPHQPYAADPGGTCGCDAVGMPCPAQPAIPRPRRAPSPGRILELARHGHTPESIAATLGIDLTHVQTVLDADHIRDVAATAAQLAHAVRRDPAIVHATTADTTHTALAELVAVMAAMLPEDVDPTTALAWLQQPARTRAA